MKKLIVGFIVVAAIAAISVPLALAAPSPKHATGSVDWDYRGLVTGHVSFNANEKTGGSLDYQNSNGQWLHGVVTDYRQEGNTAWFAGTITDGTSDYTDGHPGTDYFFAKVVDGGTSGSNGDEIAVLANAGFDPDRGANQDYDMSQGSGLVTGGNLTVH